MYRNSMDICRTAGLQISEFCFSDPLGQAQIVQYLAFFWNLHGLVLQTVKFGTIGNSVLRRCNVETLRYPTAVKLCKGKQFLTGNIIYVQIGFRRWTQQINFNLDHSPFYFHLQDTYW